MLSTLTLALLPPGCSLPHASWSVVIKDDHILVVDKDPGLLTVPGVGEEKADSLLLRLQQGAFPEVEHVPHRLDRDTSGLIVIGRNRAAHRALSIQFQDHLVSKRYEALVLGWPEADDGIIDQPIGKVRGEDGTSRMSIVEDTSSGARRSVTKWRVQERTKSQSGAQWARLALFPVTGRAHQLRLHCSYMGHPILGDELHGNRAAIAFEGVSRLCLHAAELSFAHPARQERVNVCSPRPPMST
jgi:tRNA pseudouridine32 synthase/23S rRNA pseudouridine746 synthase